MIVERVVNPEIPETSRDTATSIAALYRERSPSPAAVMMTSVTTQHEAAAPVRLIARAATTTVMVCTVDFSPVVAAEVLLQGSYRQDRSSDGHSSKQSYRNYHNRYQGDNGKTIGSRGSRQAAQLPTSGIDRRTGSAMSALRERADIGRQIAARSPLQRHQAQEQSRLQHQSSIGGRMIRSSHSCLE